MIRAEGSRALLIYPVSEPQSFAVIFVLLDQVSFKSLDCFFDLAFLRKRFFACSSRFASAYALLRSHALYLYYHPVAVSPFNTCLDRSGLNRLAIITSPRRSLCILGPSSASGFQAAFSFSVSRLVLIYKDLSLLAFLGFCVGFLLGDNDSVLAFMSTLKISHLIVSLTMAAPPACRPRPSNWTMLFIMQIAVQRIEGCSGLGV